MNAIKFCYEIHKDAGLAYDRKTGENAKSYMSVDITLDQKLSDDEFKTIHESEMINGITNQTRIKKEHIKPVSLSEFNANTSEEHKQTI